MKRFIECNRDLSQGLVAFVEATRGFAVHLSGLSNHVLPLLLSLCAELIHLSLRMFHCLSGAMHGEGVATLVVVSGFSGRRRRLRMRLAPCQC